MNARPPQSDASENAEPSAPPAAALGASGPAGEAPQAFVIPRALAQATLDYLASQPYRDVYPLVRGFEALEPIPQSPGRDETGER
jgi:hypothetical protein